MVRRCDLGVFCNRGRGLERDAAEQQRTQRLHLDIETCSTELHRNAGGIPKACLVCHIGVVRRSDEGVYRHVLGHVAEVPAQHLAD
jgi:hypothetical protein